MFFVHWSPKSVGELFATHLGKALAAVDRTVLAGLKGNSGFLTAVCANSGMHLTVSFGCVLAGITASFATLGLIHETLGSIEFLFASSENKLRAAVFADKCLILVHVLLPRFENDFSPGRIQTDTFDTNALT